MARIRFTKLSGAVTALVVVGCVTSEPPPNIPLQAEIRYGNKIYLVDFSENSPDGNACTRFATVSQTSSVVTVVPGFGTGQISDLSEPHNCFIPVVGDANRRSLKVDQIEVTNDLFQLCVDSDVCDEPDPADASKAQVCSNEDDFDRCPVVSVPFDQAETLCKYIGRRLPTMVEHIAIRQAGFIDPDNPQPSQMRPFVYTDRIDPPGPCADALLNSEVCNAVRPAPVGSQSNPQGSAANDVVMGAGGQIFDLTGSMQEWSQDSFASEEFRGGARGLPWFCVAKLPSAGDPAVRPTCPANAHCVYADYEPDGFPYDTYALCITNPNAAFSGNLGALAGGGIQDMIVDARTVGVFARRTEGDPRGETVVLSARTDSAVSTMPPPSMKTVVSRSTSSRSPPARPPDRERSDPQTSAGRLKPLGCHPRTRALVPFEVVDLEVEDFVRVLLLGRFGLSGLGLAAGRLATVHAATRFRRFGEFGANRSTLLRRERPLGAAEPAFGELHRHEVVAGQRGRKRRKAQLLAARHEHDFRAVGLRLKTNIHDRRHLGGRVGHRLRRARGRARDPVRPSPGRQVVHG